MSHIGGFFELEQRRGAASWHRGAIALSSGRACLTAILDEVRPRRLHLPYYICGVVPHAAREAGVPVEFYRLDESLRPRNLAGIGRNDLLLAVNYFGLQGPLMQRLAQRFGARFIADESQAFFEGRVRGAWSFNSARKSFGVPDGGFLYAPRKIRIDAPSSDDVDVRHLVNRRDGKQGLAYRQATEYERRFDGRVKTMSALSRNLLAGVDRAAARRARRANYRALHALLGPMNQFAVELPADAVPFCYPLVLDRPVSREALAKQRLYVPTFWKEVARDPRAPRFEREFAARLLPLPVDHRYQTTDAEEIASRLRRVLESST